SAGLLVRGARHQAGAFDPGFTIDGVTVVSFDLPPRDYDDKRRRTFLEDLATALGTLPPGAIDAFGFATWEPAFLRRGFPVPIRLPGQAAEQSRTTLSQEVSATYLGVLGIPIVAGRNLTASDAGGPAVLVNETMARHVWPGET